MLVEKFFALSKLSPLFQVVEFLDEDVDPFDKEVWALPNGTPLAVGLASDQVPTDLLDLCCENVVAKYNSIKFFDSLLDVLKILQGLRILSVYETLNRIN